MVNEGLARMAEAMGFAAHDGDPHVVMAWGLAIVSKCCEILTDKETGARFCGEVLKRRAAMDDARFFLVQIQNGRYWEPSAPWETIQIMSCEQDAVEYAQHEADAGRQVRVVRYTMARTVLREWRLTRHAEETAERCEAAIAQRKAVIECALCGDEPGGKYRMTWYMRGKTGAVYCGACVAKMLAANPYDEMRICDALEAMGLQLIEPDDEN